MLENYTKFKIHSGEQEPVFVILYSPGYPRTVSTRGTEGPLPRRRIWRGLSPYKHITFCCYRRCVGHSLLKLIVGHHGLSGLSYLLTTRVTAHTTILKTGAETGLTCVCVCVCVCVRVELR